MKKKEAQKATNNVEFGSEFLDLNASKNYEILSSNQKDKKKNKS